jgi:hypothetical protein
MIARGNAREIIAVEREVRAILVAHVTGELSLGTAVKLLAAAAVGGSAEAVPAERRAERQAREDAEDLAQMAELESQGRGREAAGIVARQRVDRYDPGAVESETHRLRGLRRRQKRRV